MAHANEAKTTPSAGALRAAEDISSRLYAMGLIEAGDREHLHDFAAMIDEQTSAPELAAALRDVDHDCRACPISEDENPEIRRETWDAARAALEKAGLLDV